MDLAERIRKLVEDQGLTEEEALEVAAASIKAKRGSTGTNSLASRREPDYLARTDGRTPVDYGNETAAEAKRRWIEQEKQDPQGIYSLGGSSAAGIFGNSPIVTEDYDPEAVARSISGHAQLETLRVQREMLQELQESRRERQLSTEHQRQLEERRARQLDEGRGARRLLGRKRRKG